MKTPLSRNNDLEAGSTPLLYPSMTENPERRWAFIRKVYAILAFQLLLTIPVAATAFLNPGIAVFLVETWLGWFLKHTIIITSVSGKVVLEAAILTVAIFLSLTLYTFWAARRGHDFNFLGPFLFASLLTLVVFGVIQIFLPLGKISHMIYGIVGILVFCGYIVYDTDELIKRYQYDEYILAAIDLYLDLLNLFLKILEVMKDAESSDDA
ncbi:protein LIFEGUARD 4-like [Argentina anserina]|uniref:protein LIFEGUARD 4-like n=1 Tax=Argentina anserina TaxID=57926 RepID=UPI00217685C6|nr:protein LIFEGUARD 4-like [Potentilla anserina]